DLDGELVFFRDDQHQRLAGLNDAAYGMDIGLMDDAALRRADVDAHELVLRRHAALHQFGALALDLAQLLGHLAAEILVDLDGLQLDLGDLALRLRDAGDELSAFAGDPYRFPLQLHQALDLHQVLLPQLAHAFEFAVDQLDLARLGGGLAGHA